MALWGKTVSDAYHLDMSGDADDFRIGELLKLAGPRPMPDPAHAEAARAAARAEWVRVVERRAWRVSFWRLSAAALVTAASAVTIWVGVGQPPSAGPVSQIATVQTVTGTMFVTSVDRARRSVSHAGTPLRTGDRIETADLARAAFALEADVSVRLDQSSSVVLDSPDRLTLERGAVYVDARIAPRGIGLRVDTPFGSVRHVGTQFEVRLRDDGLGIRVREGTVSVEQGTLRWTTRAGERLVVVRGRPPERESIETFGQDWAWIETLAPPFRLEGSTVPEFLSWAARELGLRWEYENPTIGQRADRTILHGSVDGLRPEEALAAVLPTCGLTSRRAGSRLVVSAAVH